jgi:hypothetical protein
VGIPQTEIEVNTHGKDTKHSRYHRQRLQSGTTPARSSADLGAIILEMKREEKYYGKHTKRMTELTKLAEVQQRVMSRFLDRAIENSDKPKRPRLKIVK